MRAFVAAGLTLLALTGTAAAQPPWVPTPAPRYEQMPPPHREGLMWQPGHWRWDGYRYEWRPGHYIERHPHHRRFVEGHWDFSHREGRRIWIPEHWE
jgi:hypothetical protein